MKKIHTRLLTVGASLFLLANSPLHAAWNPPAGFQILQDTLSPDGTMGVIAPDLKHYKEDGPSQNKLMNVETGDEVAPLNAERNYMKDPEVVQNYCDPVPAWSKDGSLFSWSLQSKWSHDAGILTRVEDGAMAWQTDLLSLVQKRILAKTRAAVPENYAAAKKKNAGNGGDYPDGFTIDYAPPEAGFTLPWKGHATLESNDKDITEDWPPAANVAASMDFVVSEDGTVAYSNFKIDRKRTGVSREDDAGPDAAADDSTDATTDAAADDAKTDSANATTDTAGFSAEEVNDSVRDWVKDYVNIESGNDLDRLVGTYWETVDYMGDGDVDTDYIRKDKAAYIKQWPMRKVTITGDIDVESKGDDTNWTVTYPTHITLKKKNGDTMSMDALNFLTVTLAGETYAISSEHANLSNKTTGGASAAKASIDPSLIIGTWLGDKYLTFFKNGVFGVQKYEGAPMDKKGRKWTLKGNKITWTTPDDTWDETIISLTAKKLVIKDPDGNLSTFTR